MQVPAFLKRHVLVKGAFGANVVPSGTVISEMNCARSVQPGTGVGVGVVGVTVPVGVGVFVAPPTLVGVAVGVIGVTVPVTVGVAVGVPGAGVGVAVGPGTFTFRTMRGATQSGWSPTDGPAAYTERTSCAFLRFATGERSRST